VEGDVHSIYDLATMAIFAGLVVLFLQRSTSPEPQDNVLLYLPPAGGCALANYVGNEGHGIVAALIILAVILYSYFILKPFKFKP
jgi:hypothetical protein